MKKVLWRGHLKEVFLPSPYGSLLLPRSACVSEGDKVVVAPNGAWVQCKNSAARILPNYVARETLAVGNLNLDLVVKEITAPEEFAAYEAMTEFHYRGRTLHGRTARLIVRNFHPLYPKVIGYVELATPFYMNKARTTILDAPFELDGVSWKRWNMPAMRHYIHVIVRIARCVVYPEFRGLGLGQVLVKHAATFARDRWQVAGLKPYFIEISADMLKFVPFASKAGMLFIGETEGNLKRVAQDMIYLLKNRPRVKDREIVKEESCGIVDQQVARMDRAAALMKREDWTLEELQVRLERLSTKSILRDFNLLHDIVSLPKPTYMLGLVPKAQEFLATRVAEVAPCNGLFPPPLQSDSLPQPIVLKNVSVTYESNVRRTAKTHAIQQAFGISPERFSHAVVRNLSLRVEPSHVVLITGPSGSGKSTLLRLFAGDDCRLVSGKITRPKSYRPGEFTPIRSKKAMIELLHGHDVQAALHLMGLVGLSDAFIYLKRFAELSNGQQHRAMLARLIASGCNVWLADEFCANLDVITANVVADRLQRIARQLGAVLIVASSHPEVFAAALRPDQVVHLTTTWEHSVMTGTDFLQRMQQRCTRFSMPSLPVSANDLQLIRTGRKTSIIRMGQQETEQGLLLLTARGDTEIVNVTSVRHLHADNLTVNDARCAGFRSLRRLMSALRKHGSRPSSMNVATIISIAPICSMRDDNDRRMDQQCVGSTTRNR
ncbi:MAG TPA: ATP-binding cassette domain-containing protein [Candidatus Cryosericum sp.]